MNIKEFYNKTGADCTDVLLRLVNEKMVRKYLKKYPEDQSFARLTKLLNEHNYEDALYASGTFKGLCSTLGFANISEKAEQMYSLLASQKYDGTEAVLADIQAENQRVIEWISLLE